MQDLPILDFSRFLFQRGVDVGELAVQLAADAVDGGDDDQRDAGSNQTVFNGGSTGLVLYETRNKILHNTNSMGTLAVELRFGPAGVLSTVTMHVP